MSMDKSLNVKREVAKLEKEIRKNKERLAKLRRRVPKKLVPDYVLLATGSKPVNLSSLFGKKSELILIHNMGKSCPYCALWADGFNGMLPHLEDRAAFVVESPDLPEIQAKIAAKRGWKFRFVSSKGSSLKKDMGFETEEGDPMPGVSTFLKDKHGKIYQLASTIFGPGDNYCSMWDLCDLLPAGDWGAKMNYPKSR